MAFTVKDFQDLIQLLSERPDWREELRRTLLSDDFLALPGLVRELAEAQKRTEERLTRLEQVVAELAEAQKRTEARLEHLIVSQEKTEQALRLIANRQNKVLGDILEDKYARRAYSYFGRMLRRVQTILPGPALKSDIEDLWESRLTYEELMELFETDVIAVGRLRQARADASAEVWLAVEASAVIDQDDVERAQQRAALLRKIGYQAIPVVAGEGVTQEATEALRDSPVVLVLDGRSQGWEAALAKWGRAGD